MRYASAEDRLNPDVPDGTPDDTLGGYLRVHGRAAAFEGVDGAPYTVAAEAEATGRAGEDAWAAYLVFIRWAATGTAIMGHLESDDLAFAATEPEARAALEALSLARVRQVLDDTIRRRGAAADDDDEEGAAP